MAEPTCRICYLASLPQAVRDRVIAEVPTQPIFYCDEHKVLDIEQRIAHLPFKMVDAKVDVHGTVTGRLVRTTPSVHDMPRFGTRQSDPDYLREVAEGDPHG